MPDSNLEELGRAVVEVDLAEKACIDFASTPGEAIGDLKAVTTRIGVARRTLRFLLDQYHARHGAQKAVQ